MRTGISYRVVVAGAELRMLVLATDGHGSVGVDLDSGAFVRASHPDPSTPFAAFDVVSAEIAGSVEPPDAARPEAVELGEPPRRVGRVSPRRAERYLLPLRHPPRLPLLGLGPPAVPYWTLSGDRPSLALVDVRHTPRLEWDADELVCHFEWQGADHALPVTDPEVGAAAAQAGRRRLSRGNVERLLGYRPRRVLVVLTPPAGGYCRKAVAALLPTR